MIAEYRCVVDLGTVRVAVVTDHADLADYLREFYPVNGHGEVEWTIDARAGQPVSGMALTPWRVGYQANPATRQVVIRSSNARNLAITTRKAVREVLLDYCEAHRYTMLHASAVVDERRVIVIVGDTGSGKTTLAMNGTLAAGYRYLANDHLILYRAAEGLVVTSLPTPIPVKIGTYLDYAEQLDPPWDNDGVDLEEYRRMPRSRCYGHDRRLFYTYRGLGQANPLHIALTDRQVIVVLAGYAPAAVSEGIPALVDDPMAVLWPHVRFDWVFDPALNTHQLPRAERDRDTYGQDSRRRLAELVAGSLVIEWRHHGRLSPLLGWLAHQPGGPR
ncbi:MAG: hypothetical protein ACRDRI_22690 [Pseudonocardiaceae bacterium]